MSYSSLWVMDKDFNGDEVKEFNNSWWFSIVAWDILLNKYIPDPRGSKRSFLGAVMCDNTLNGKLNEKINNSSVQEDRILWELGNQQVFFTKDKDFVIDCINRFLVTNKKDAVEQELGSHIYERFAEVAKAIKEIDENKHPYFIFKNTSCDDNVEYWFSKYNEEEDESEASSLKDLDKVVTEFVIVKDNKIVGFKNNLDYFSGDDLE